MKTKALLTTSVVTLAGVLGVVGSASAATLTQTFSSTVPIQDLNFNIPVNLPQFDPSLGTLSMVTVTLDGTVIGDAQAENLSTNSPSTINLSLAGNLVATGPVALSVAVNPVNNQVFNATTFDGLFDFGGTSGVSFLGISATDSDSSMLSLPTDLSPYIGLGNVSFTLAGTGASVATGGGTIASIFNTDAGGTLTITYKYETDDVVPTPEPSTLIGLGLVAGLGSLVRRKRA